MIKRAIKDTQGYTVVYGLYGDDAERITDGAITTIDLTPVIALGVRSLRLAVAIGPTRQAVKQAIERQFGPLPFTCPRCGRASHHPLDRKYGYCGACNDYTGAPS
ncbi:MAG TPA: hypothetical protein VJM75_01655 [Acidimicrobiales bacterium]|nr:hypothetical protein [Acidimicrobiales bacterium]